MKIKNLFAAFFLAIALNTSSATALTNEQICGTAGLIMFGSGIYCWCKEKQRKVLGSTLLAGGIYAITHSDSIASRGLMNTLKTSVNSVKHFFNGNASFEEQIHYHFNRFADRFNSYFSS